MQQKKATKKQKEQTKKQKKQRLRVTPSFLLSKNGRVQSC